MYIICHRAVFQCEYSLALTCGNNVMVLLQAVVDYVRNNPGGSAHNRLDAQSPQVITSDTSSNVGPTKRKQPLKKKKKTMKGKRQEAESSSSDNDMPSSSSVNDTLTRHTSDVHVKELLKEVQNFDTEAMFAANIFLRLARAYPPVYLQVVGHSLVMTEMIAVLTPSVAIGLQWMFALCPGTVSQSLYGLLHLLYDCVLHQQCHADTHCINHVTNTLVDAIAELRR